MFHLPSLSPSSRPFTSPNQRKSIFAPPIVPATEEVDRSLLLFSDAHKKKSFSLDDEYVEPFQENADKSAWNVHASFVKTRPRGWLQRFAVKLDESNIKQPPPTVSELRERRIKESGWENITIPKTALVVADPVPEENATLNPYPAQAPKLRNCAYCGLNVPIGAEFVLCQSCPVVAHINCLPDIDDHVTKPTSRNQPRLGNIIEEKRENMSSSHPNKQTKRLQFTLPADKTTSPLRNHSNSKVIISSSRPRSSPGIMGGQNITSNGLLASNLTWVCGFCRADASAYVGHAKEVDSHKREKVAMLKSIVILQSFYRMITPRIRYIKLLKGLKMLQNVFRMRRLVAKSEEDRANQRYTYRLRLHDLKFIVDNATLAELLGNNPGNSNSTSHAHHGHHRGTAEFPYLDKPHIIGELNSISYDKHFGLTKQTSSPNSPSNPNAATTLTTAVTMDAKDEELLDFLSEGYTEPAGNYAKSYRNVQGLPRGSVFLTVSLHEHLHDSHWTDKSGGDGGQFSRKPVQLCRYDLQLKEDAKPHRLRPSLLHTLGYKHLSPAELDRLCRHYSLLSYFPPKPYLLIPYSRANTELRFTVSQVTDWPKSEVIGTNAFNIRYYVTRHRVVSVVQSLFPAAFVDLPAPEEGGKLSLVLPREMSSHSLSPSRPVSRVQRETAASRGGLKEGEGGPAGGVKKKKAGREFAHVLVPWTLMTMGYSEVNETGFLMTLNQEAVTSTKKKNWCVLLDKSLYIFHVIRDNIQLKHVLDIKTCYVQLLQNDVFRVKFPTETLYFLALTKREHETWFKKVYSQSLSNNSVPYSIYVKKRLPARASFITKTMYGAESQVGGKKHSVSHSSTTSTSSAGGFVVNHTPSNYPSRRRSSMEEVELLSLEVDTFLARMQNKYLEGYASTLPTLGSPKRGKRGSVAVAGEAKRDGAGRVSVDFTLNIERGIGGLGLGSSGGALTGGEMDFKDFPVEHWAEGVKNQGLTGGDRTEGWHSALGGGNRGLVAGRKESNQGRLTRGGGKGGRESLLDNFTSTVMNARSIFL